VVKKWSGQRSVPAPNAYVKSPTNGEASSIKITLNYRITSSDDPLHPAAKRLD
jgi:hypothetical protein